jgi:enterochelin esterase-like enzyme
MQRDLLVWVPPGYDDPQNAGRDYPVLILLDGQNVFAGRPGLPGEWHADETASELIASGEVEPLLIVAIPNAGRARGDEYIPFGDLPGVEPAGDAFVAWLKDTVLREVRANYRVSDDRRDVGIGGASLGGLISLYAIATEPGTFGKALVESCSKLPGTEGELFRVMDRAWASGDRPRPERIVVGMGSREVSFAQRDTERNALYRDWAATLDAQLEACGVPDDARRLVIGDGHHHHEPAWAERFRGALGFLFPAE